MKWFAKLEQKFGRYAIRGLMRYVVGISILGTFLGLFDQGLYLNYLSLDISQILHGQVWRLVTFVLYPSVSLQGGAAFINIIFYAISLYVYFSIGSVLERIWGSFRFNAFYFTGILLTILAAFGYYLVLLNANGSVFASAIGMGLAMVISLDNLNLSLFLVFAFLFPETRFYFNFIIPVKAKWLGYLYLGFNAIQIVKCIQRGHFQSIMSMLLIVAALVDFVIFYLIARNPQGFGAAMRQKKRRVVYRNTAQQHISGPRHRCAICGRTEKDSPNLEFRFCSKCEGNYEYCSDHLFTHEHVRRGETGRNDTNERKE
ncbi:MAG: rhomboid family intramembrane serine protease [Eubacterium sp.]|nr:rhomboid family intramembrane serine protease [Eubacterium sp.]